MFLAKRNGVLCFFAGQETGGSDARTWSIMGGRKNASDMSPEHTANRETSEEMLHVVNPRNFSLINQGRHMSFEFFVRDATNTSLAIPVNAAVNSHRGHVEMINFVWFPLNNIRANLRQAGPQEQLFLVPEGCSVPCPIRPLTKAILESLIAKRAI